MALADYVPERTEITHKGRSLVSVRGLCLDDISILIRSHFQVIRQVYDITERGEIGEFGGDAFFIELMTVAPDLLFNVIALAADEAEYGAEARKLPVGVQINALKEIVRLTFEDIGGPLAFGALVQKMVKQLPSPLPTIQ